MKSMSPPPSKQTLSELFDRVKIDPHFLKNSFYLY